MSYGSLHEFVERLEMADELVNVKVYADPVLEIPEITDRMSKSAGGGKALLFTNTGTGFPVLMNAMGSYRRMCMALGVNELDDIGRKMNQVFQQFSGAGDGFVQKLAMLPRLGHLASIFPSVSSKKAACQQVVHHHPDLSILPVLKTWPF
ncbi:MAG TPA: UbiD family decarboxylase, partial [Bacteroidales bacterium]|nr:UbiD family decarboxylase [Bacteroidales bacterium]